MITHRGVVIATRGAVAASQPLAVSAGLSVLAQGGSFADAAIATSAVLCVVEPHNSHLGGEAFLIVYDASSRQTLAFNGSGAAPASAAVESYRDGIPTRGIRAATVPGLVSVWETLHAKYGTMPLQRLLAPAIGYARDGYACGPRVARVCAANAPLFHAHPSLRSLGLSAGTRVGDPVYQPDLATTLETIGRDGPVAFYRGAVAERIVAGSNGHFSREDLAGHRTRQLSPLTVRYRDLLVHGQPPPSQGHILLQMLQFANGFDMARMSEAERIHILVEAKKMAFADRNAYLADPERAAVPVDALLSETYIAQQRARISPDRAALVYEPGEVDHGRDTTYFLVADRNGNAVSFIQSIFHGFGCAEVVEGTGILFNNRMTGFSLEVGSPNCLAPGKRPAHTLNAWAATWPDGRLAHVGGTPGGHVQVQTNLQLLMNLVDGKWNPQEAIELPRWQHMTASGAVGEPSGPGVLEMESRFATETVSRLREKGHDIRVIGPWEHGSSAQLLTVLPNGVYALGSDPRCDGHAAGI